VFIAASGPGQGQVREHRLEARIGRGQRHPSAHNLSVLRCAKHGARQAHSRNFWEIKMPGRQQHYDRLVALRADARAKRQAILDRCERDNRDQLTMDETRWLTAQSSSTTTTPLGS
jgi:hypothetical protein